MGVILLVRHGRASAGAANYDVLSTDGELQSERLGMELRRRGVVASRVVTGSLNRQRDTAFQVWQAAGWPAEIEVDVAWNEFDHENVRAVFDASPAGTAIATRGGDPLALDEVIPRWSAGAHDHEYAEPFGDFTERVDAALRKLAAGLGSGETAVVFTSSGVIGWVVASLLGTGEPQWHLLNRVGVNCGVTKAVAGKQGISLVSFNDHSHLTPGFVTYT